MRSYKKIIVLLAVILCGIGMANAQVRFGVKAGLNINSLHLKNLGDNFKDDNKCGYTIGVMTEFKVPIVGLGFDLSAMYTRMNSEIDSKSTERVAYNKNFLEIPLNLKYRLGLPIIGSVFTPYIFTGPSFAFKLDKNMADAIKTKTCQTAWNVGLGFELVKHLQIQGSYGFGMNNIISDKIGVNAVTSKVKNNYWTVTAAYLF